MMEREKIKLDFDKMPKMAEPKYFSNWVTFLSYVHENYGNEIEEICIQELTSLSSDDEVDAHNILSKACQIREDNMEDPLDILAGALAYSE